MPVRAAAASMSELVKRKTEDVGAKFEDGILRISDSQDSAQAIAAKKYHCNRITFAALRGGIFCPGFILS